MHREAPSVESLPARVQELFSSKGILANAKNFEFRPQQQQMASAIAKALENRDHLIVEAGTGVGKSLGYLLPSILHALENTRKALISTHTINLQEQLFEKDLPLARKILKQDFQAALLKGRSHYLCPKRLERALHQPGELFVSEEVETLRKLWEKLQEKGGVTLSDLDFTPSPHAWAQVCSEPHLCTPRTCGADPQCAYQRARANAATAQVVVLNHSLFFNFLAGSDEEDPEREGFLFSNDFVVLDEAHTIEGVAARHLGFEVSQGGLVRLLHRLYNPKTQKGLLVLLRNPEAVRLTVQALGKSEEFFSTMDEFLPEGKAKEIRLRKPPTVENVLQTPCKQLARLLQDLCKDVSEEWMQAELEEAANALNQAENNLSQFLTQPMDDHVYWAERQEKQQDRLRFLGCPIDVAPYLQKLLFRQGTSAIFTSATLSTGKDLSYFQNRMGGHDAATVQVGSPFAYEKQMKVFIPKKMPDPKEKKAYEEALAFWIQHFITLTHGKAFVLFTSYQTMQTLAQALEGFFEKLGVACLVQGQKLPRNRLLEKFKQDKNSVLFGTDSFWQGVDVPGEALSNVIITRLPFAVPEHPLTQSKLEHIEAQGGDSFMDYSLPEAILKFRQGIGRLIRTQEDQGIVAILDNRILSKNYGKAFLAALPTCPVEIVGT